MLKQILSISGKPGLFKLASNGKNTIIVESLLTGKKMPVFSQEKAISLGDIAIFTEETEAPLNEVFAQIFAKEDGKASSVSPKADNETLKSYFAEVLPNFDRERVYPNDIKKVLSWYNLLVEKDYSELFLSTEEETAE